MACLHNMSALFFRHLFTEGKKKETSTCFLILSHLSLAFRKTVKPKMDLFSSPRAEVCAVAFFLFVVTLVTISMATHRVTTFKLNTYSECTTSPRSIPCEPVGTLSVTVSHDRHTTLQSHSCSTALLCETLKQVT